MYGGGWEDRGRSVCACGRLWIKEESLDLKWLYLIFNS